MLLLQLMVIGGGKGRPYTGPPPNGGTISLVKYVYNGTVIS